VVSDVDTDLICSMGEDGEIHYSKYEKGKTIEITEEEFRKILMNYHKEVDIDEH